VIARVIVYCDKCKLVYSDPLYRHVIECIRCDGKVVTEVRDFLAGGGSLSDLSDTSIFHVSMAKRYQYWNHFVARWFIAPGEKRGVTGPRLRRIMPQIMDDEDFWWDVVSRHSGDKMTPEEMAETEPHIYQHCEGNFWGMVCQDLVEMGLMK